MTKDELRVKLIAARQIAAVATAFTLPFSTSGQAISVSILAVLALLTLDPQHALQTLRRPAAYLPLLLFAFMAVGVLWSMQPFGAAIKWVGPYAKLLLIPLLMATAFTPRQALQIGLGFVASCAMVMVLSYAALLWPSGPWDWFKSPGVPFKDNAVQSECLALCAYGLAIGAVRIMRQGDTRRAAALLLLALLFFADVFLIYISKTGMLVAAALFGLFLIEVGGWKRAVVLGAAAVLLAGAALWVSAPAQKRLAEISIDINAGSARAGGGETVSTASRLDFWSKASEFVKQAPLFGHGTGSIRPLYQSLEATRPSPYGEAVSDPHNQFLHVVLQIGLIGGVVLLAMWIAHVSMFMTRHWPSVIGMAVVVQNLIGSLFNSHLSQVTQGMLYCVAVGILGAVAQSRATDIAPSLRTMGTAHQSETA